MAPKVGVSWTISGKDSDLANISWVDIDEWMNVGLGAVHGNPWMRSKAFGLDLLVWENRWGICNQSRCDWSHTYSVPFFSWVTLWISAMDGEFCHNIKAWLRCIGQAQGLHKHHTHAEKGEGMFIWYKENHGDKKRERERKYVFPYHVPHWV